MPEVTEETIEELENIAEAEDVEFESVREEFKDKYEEVEERSQDFSDEKVEELALRMTRTSTFSANRVPTDEIEMLTIGGDVRNTSNDDMFFGTAVVDENPNDDNSMVKLASVTIYDDEMAHRVYDAFDHVGNVVSGNFAVQDGDLTNHLEVSESDDTDFEVHRPDDRSDLIEVIRDVVPKTSIASIADDMVRMTRGEDGEQYPVSSDIRRIEADVYDGYKNPDSGTGIYTLRDDTVFDEEDVADSPVFDASEADDNVTPGMTCFFDPNKMEWGSDSIVEFFGTVQKNEDGIINFSADGAVPIFPNEDGFDGYTDSEDEEESGPDRTTTSSADRMNI